MNKIAIALLFCICLQATQCTLGVDVSQLFSTGTYQCMHNNGYIFAIIRGYCSYGGVDHNVVQGLQNARSAGMITDVYMFPCRGKSGTAQVDEMMNAIPGSLYGMIWIDVETNPSPGCSWSGHDAASNCNFVMEIVGRIKSHGKVPAIYGSAYMWQTIFGSRGGCTQAASQQLWYAHYDGSPSFSDFSSFGGWSKPAIKQYVGDTTLCGAGVDKNYY